METVEFNQELYEKNLQENDFSSREDDGLTPEQIAKVKEDLENGLNN